MRKQVVVINGGETFDSYKDYLTSLKIHKLDYEKLIRRGWKANLEKDLGNEFIVVNMEMPNRRNAKYLEWKIWFDKLIPFLRDNLILVGHSLGGLFLAKYLSENKLPKKINGVLLVSPPYFDRKSSYSLAGFSLPSTLKKFEDQGGKIILYHSRDDSNVPFADFEKYIKRIPNVQARIFTNRGHFAKQKNFPELISDIKSL